MNSGYVLIKNCILYNQVDKSDTVDILISDKKIKEVGKIGNEQSAKIINVEKRLAVPGFIDLHIQGAGGADVLDNTPEALKTIAKTLARLGTTSYLGTTIVKSEKGNKHLKLLNEYTNKNTGGANLLGIHLEGPFININKKGGLSAEAIYQPSLKGLDEIFKATGHSLKMMTIAPEIPGNLEIIKKLVANGVIASFAHSDANYEETKKGFDAGISHVTHIFNAMRPIHHRNPGPLTAIFENEKIPVQIISDGHHIHPSIVNLVYRLVGGDRCICITDGMHGIGLPDGIYTYNGKKYESKDGAAKYPDGTLIGSTMSLGNIVFQFMKFTGCSLETAIDSVTKNPAKLLGIYNRKGSIDLGKDADIVILNDDHSVYMTLVNGEIVYLK